MLKRAKFLNILLFFISLELIGGIGMSILGFQYIGIIEETTICMKTLGQNELRIDQGNINRTSASIDNEDKACKWIIDQSKIYGFNIYLTESGKLIIQKDFLSLNFQDSIYVIHVITIIASLIYCIICCLYDYVISNSEIILCGILGSIISATLGLRFNLFIGILGIFAILILIIVIEYVLLTIQKKNIITD